MAAKKAAQRAAASGILARPSYDDGRGDSGPLSLEENARASLPALQGTALDQQWKGLAKGASADGVSFAAGRPVLRANFSGGARGTCMQTWVIGKRLSTCHATKSDAYRNWSHSTPTRSTRSHRRVCPSDFVARPVEGLFPRASCTFISALSGCHFAVVAESCCKELRDLLTTSLWRCTALTALARHSACIESLAGILTLEAYSRSLKSFGARLAGRARALLERTLATAAKPPEPRPAAAMPAGRPLGAVPMQQGWPNPGRKRHLLARQRVKGVVISAQAAKRRHMFLCRKVWTLAQPGMPICL